MSDYVEVLQAMLNEEASRLSLQNYEREAIKAAISSLRQVPEEGARTVRLDLSVFDQPGDPRSNLIARGWAPPQANPAPPLNDEELPGMWSHADFMGGKTDCEANPVLPTSDDDDDEAPAPTPMQIEYARGYIDGARDAEERAAERQEMEPTPAGAQAVASPYFELTIKDGNWTGTYDEWRNRYSYAQAGAELPVGLVEERDELSNNLGMAMNVVANMTKRAEAAERGLEEACKMITELRDYVVNERDAQVLPRKAASYQREIDTIDSFLAARNSK